MIFKNLFKKEKDTPKLENKLLVIGDNHYNVWENRGSILRKNIPKDIMYLNFCEAYVKLGLQRRKNSTGETEFVWEKDRENGKVLNIHELNFVEVMRPKYAITQDGRIFMDENEDMLLKEEYEKIVDYLN